jgi:hypothetical protein
MPEPTSGSRKREIFLQALDQPTPQERAAFLEAACGGEEELRRAVEALLVHHAQDAFLEKPAVAVTPDVASTVAALEKPGDRIGRYELLSLPSHL